mgnify:CR=1 FL=1
MTKAIVLADKPDARILKSSLECHQEFLPGRAKTTQDILLDT